MTHATIGFSPRFHLDDSQNPFHSFLIFLRRKEGIQANTLCKKSVRILVKFAPFTAYRGIVSGHEGATLAARSVGKVTVSLVPANWGRLCLRTILDLKNMCILQLKTGVPAYQQERVR